MTGGLAVDCNTAVGCTNNDDCASDVCTFNSTCPGGGNCGTCAAPTCLDGKKNGLETDQDCGGGACGGCADLLGCIGNSDCQSGVCNSTVNTAGTNGTLRPSRMPRRRATTATRRTSTAAAAAAGSATSVRAARTTATAHRRRSANPPVDCDDDERPVRRGQHADLRAGEILQVAVTGTGSVSSALAPPPPVYLETGDITSCTSSAGTCVQSYSTNAVVNLTATSSKTTGSITWTVTPGSGPAQTCASCPLSATPPTTCPCQVTLSDNVGVAASVP